MRRIDDISEQSSLSMSPTVHAALNLPEEHQFLGGMMIGYPKMKYHRIPMRNEPQLNWR